MFSSRKAELEHAGNVIQIGIHTLSVDSQQFATDQIARTLKER